MSVDTIDRTDGGHKPTDESADAPELVSGGAFDARSLITSPPQAARKLNPKGQARNPVIFANLAEAVAGGRGRAQACSLRKVNRDNMVRRIGADG